MATVKRISVTKRGSHSKCGQEGEPSTLGWRWCEGCRTLYRVGVFRRRVYVPTPKGKTRAVLAWAIVPNRVNAKINACRMVRHKIKVNKDFKVIPVRITPIKERRR